MNRFEGWHLYWVSSDGIEDCFVVARNSRSAAKVEVDYFGGDPEEVNARKVLAIPAGVVRGFVSRRRKMRLDFTLPWYADETLIKKLGGSSRTRDGLNETVIDEVVYTAGSDGSLAPREIGNRYARSIASAPEVQVFGRPDSYNPAQIAVFTLLGICVGRIQEIEYLIAHSFILGGYTVPERGKYELVWDLIRAWKKMTLGQMLRAIESGWHIDETLHGALKAFLAMRNQLIHGITMEEQYSIDDPWGRAELVRFLSSFELISRLVREAFQGSFWTSLAIRGEFQGNDAIKKPRLTKRRQLQAAMFVEFLSQKCRRNLNPFHRMARISESRNQRTASNEWFMQTTWPALSKHELLPFCHVAA